MMNKNLLNLKHFWARRSVKIFTGRLLTLCILSLLLVIYNSAQVPNRRNTRAKIKPVSAKSNIQLKANAGGTSDDAANNNAKSAVSVINLPEADYLSGETNVSVNPQQPTVIRLGLAQNATSVVEFPMVDQLYYLHEGNPKLVTVFQSPTKETDRSITLYPGEGFLPAPKGQKELSVTITLQMRSGLIIVLEIVPAPDIRQNAHRCVLHYNLAEVIAARQAAGLKTNLGDESVSEKAKATRAVSTLVANDSQANSDKAANYASDVKADSTSAIPLPSFIEIKSGMPQGDEAAGRRKQVKSGADLSRLVKKKLAETVKVPDGKFTGWSDTKQGLSLSTTKIIDVDDVQRMIIVAVKNESGDALHLVEEMPELQIQTVDRTGNSLQIERVVKKYVETTAVRDTIPAGAVCYYAVVYDNPILGGNQKLLISVAHDKAADMPAVAGTNAKGIQGDSQK